MCVCHSSRQETHLWTSLYICLQLEIWNIYLASCEMTVQCVSSYLTWQLRAHALKYSTEAWTLSLSLRTKWWMLITLEEKFLQNILKNKTTLLCFFYIYTFIQRNLTSRTWTLDRSRQWHSFPAEWHINHLNNWQHQTVRSGTEPTHHRSSPTPDDVWSRFEAVAVHDAGARERQRCQIESQEDNDVDQQHYHLEV